MGQTFVANIHPSFLRVQERKAAMARLMLPSDSAQNASTEALTAEVRRLAASDRATRPRLPACAPRSTVRPKRLPTFNASLSRQRKGSSGMCSAWRMKPPRCAELRRAINGLQTEATKAAAKLEQMAAA